MLSIPSILVFQMNDLCQSNEFPMRFYLLSTEGYLNRSKKPVLVALRQKHFTVTNTIFKLLNTVYTFFFNILQYCTKSLKKWLTMMDFLLANRLLLEMHRENFRAKQIMTERWFEKQQEISCPFRRPDFAIVSDISENRTETKNQKQNRVGRNSGRHMCSIN